MTHICVSKLTMIGSDNGLSPGRRQAIIWTNAGILLIGSWGTNFSEILVAIQTFSFKKIRLKMSSGKCRPLYVGLEVATPVNLCGCNYSFKLDICPDYTEYVNVMVSQFFRLQFYHCRYFYNSQILWFNLCLFSQGHSQRTDSSDGFHRSPHHFGYEQVR